MSAWAYSLSSVAVVSLISFVGALTVAVGIRRLNWAIPLLISLAVGALLADALVHLLPEAYESTGSAALTSLYVLMGIVAFLVLERFLRWHHEHHALAVNPVLPVGRINLLADAIHNLLDGLAIGASFLVSTPIGLATTLAVVLHEIPQELGNFGVLVHAGYTPRRALFLNFLTALTAFAGAFVSLSFGASARDYSLFILPFTAGGFIYIAGADLIPELHHEHRFPSSLAQLACVLVGISLMYVLLLVEP